MPPIKHPRPPAATGFAPHKILFRSEQDFVRSRVSAAESQRPARGRSALPQFAALIPTPRASSLRGFTRLANDGHTAYFSAGGGMDISAITPGGATSTFSSVPSSSVAQLRAQIQAVQQQIAQLATDETLDEGTKETQLTALEARLRQLQAQLARAQQSQPSTASASSSNGATTSSVPSALSNTIGTLFSAYA